MCPPTIRWRTLPSHPRHRRADPFPQRRPDFHGPAALAAAGSDRPLRHEDRPELLLLQKTMVVVRAWRAALIRSSTCGHRRPGGGGLDRPEPRPVVASSRRAPASARWGRFVLDAAGLLTRAGRVVSQLDEATRNGLHLSPRRWRASAPPKPAAPSGAMRPLGDRHCAAAAGAEMVGSAAGLMDLKGELGRCRRRQPAKLRRETCLDQPSRPACRDRNQRQAPRHAALYAILARDARTGVVFRRGPSRQVQLIRWDLRDDTFEHGQWFKGRIYERRCDLSPSANCCCISRDPSGALLHLDGLVQATLLHRARPLAQGRCVGWRRHVRG